MALDVEALLRPLSEGSACGQDLDDSTLLASFDAYKVFGQPVPFDEKNDKSRKVDWRELRSKAEQALSDSKDFRLLTHLAAAAVRLDGIEAFAQALDVADTWLRDYWDDVYPRITEDPIARQNALLAFADRMAMLDALRRQPLVTNKQLGIYSCRDVELSTGTLQPSATDDQPPTQAQIAAAFQAASIDELEHLENVVGRAAAAVASIETRMRERTENAGTPSLGGLTDLLGKLRRIVKQHLDPRRAESAPDNAGVGGPDNTGSGTEDGAVATGTIPVGGIRSRHDATRALDAIGEFFRRNEPSSPVPLFVERTKRLIAMDFLQALEDIVPDAVAQARNAAGVREADH